MSNRAPSAASRRNAQRSPGPSRVLLILAGLFLLFVAAMALLARLPPAIPALYAGISMLTFIAYAADKAAARDGRRRTPENTLHLLALLGGWPGALLAQHRLRHKSRKASFLAVFWATVLLNCAVLVWLLAGNAAGVWRILAGAT